MQWSASTSVEAIKYNLIFLEKREKKKEKKGIKQPVKITPPAFCCLPQDPRRRRWLRSFHGGSLECCAQLLSAGCLWLFSLFK